MVGKKQSELLVVYLPANYSTARGIPGASASRSFIGRTAMQRSLGLVFDLHGNLDARAAWPKLLTMLIGHMLLSFSGKRKLPTSVIRRTSKLAAVNRLYAVWQTTAGFEREMKCWPSVKNRRYRIC